MVHLVIAGIAPGAQVIDLTHRVPAHDVAAGARVLVRAAPWLSGVVLALVDPGAGTRTRAVAVEAVDGRGDRPVILVGPDNGLLLSAVRALGGFGRAVEVDRGPEGGRVGATFDGRDVLAPVAAHLCNGMDLGDLGRTVDPAGLVELSDQAPTIGPDGALVGHVQWIDHFGNVELDIAGPLVAGWEPSVDVTVADGSPLTVPVVVAYQEIPAGTVGLMVDSEGWVSLAANRTSAAAALRLVEGDPIALRAGRSTPDATPPPPPTED